MSKELTTTNFDLSAPSQSIEVASILQQFVSKNNLTATIQGKKYPLVEAWQFAGSQLGLYPICIGIEDLSNAEEIKYKATVEIRRFVDDKLVSNGFAICSNKEYSKKKFDEYAICSMAQTRATGKAFRNLLAWLMKAAGFEATPAEEMDFKTAEEVKPAKPKPELTPAHEKWNGAIEALMNGKTTIDAIEKAYTLSTENREKLITSAI